MGIEISPALEYNLFPYSESTRKQLRFLYTLDGMYNVYNDTTIKDNIAGNINRIGINDKKLMCDNIIVTPIFHQYLTQYQLKL